MILFVVALVLAVVAPLIGRMVQLAVSRRRESLADVSAVELTRNPIGLARALRTIAEDPEVLEVANRATQHLYIVNPIKSFEARVEVDVGHPSADRRADRRPARPGGPVRPGPDQLHELGRLVAAQSGPVLSSPSRDATTSGPQERIDGRAEVAQLVEHRPEEAGVVSSILTLGTSTRGVPVNGRKWLSW